MAPLLMHPRPEKKTQQVHLLSLLSLQPKHPSFTGKLNFHSPENLQHCIGSSKGYLAFLDRNSDPFLLNPISQTLLRLPKTKTLPPIYLSPHLPHSKIEKLVLCGDTAIIMHAGIMHRTSVSFCSLHDDPKWTRLDTQIATCHDVVCHNATKMAFVLGLGPTVEAWDMSGPDPNMRMRIGGKGSFCPNVLARARELFPPDLYSARWYLAVSETGQVFLAVRYVGEFVRPGDGKAVREEDTITDEECGPSVYPYKTAGFDVLKHDGEKWVEVETLGDYAMFLGGNESMMVSTSGKEDYVKGNAIYFTDDYWDRVDEDYCYGGHDMGIFNLEDRRIEPVLGFDQVPKIVPPPFWISV